MLPPRPPPQACIVSLGLTFSRKITRDFTYFTEVKITWALDRISLNFFFTLCEILKSSLCQATLSDHHTRAWAWMTECAQPKAMVWVGPMGHDALHLWALRFSNVSGVTMASWPSSNLIVHGQTQETADKDVSGFMPQARKVAVITRMCSPRRTGAYKTSTECVSRWWTAQCLA